jgi:CheY-like chemotaxis protein
MNSLCQAALTTGQQWLGRLPSRVGRARSAGGTLGCVEYAWKGFGGSHLGYDATTPNRAVPLVLLGVTEPDAARPLANVLREEGMALAFALGDRACLRVAASICPDVILLDPRMPRGLLSLLRALPFSKTAHIAWSQVLAGPDAAQATTQRHTPGRWSL